MEHLTQEQSNLYAQELEAFANYIRSRNLDWGQICGLCAIVLGDVLRQEESVQRRQVSLDEIVTVIRNAAGLGKPSAH